MIFYLLLQVVSLGRLFSCKRAFDWTKSRNEHSVIIYSPSCFFKPDILKNDSVFVHTMKVSGVQNNIGPIKHLYGKKREVIQVWNNTKTEFSCFG